MSIPDFIPLDQFRNLDWMSSRFPRPDRASYIKALEQSISDIQAVMGLPEDARNLGVFDGTILPDNTTLKTVLQSIEDFLADLYTDAPVIASKVEAEEGTDNNKVMTPLRTKQAITHSLEPAVAFAIQRENHTGTQPMSSVEGLDTALAAKIALGDLKLADAQARVVAMSKLMSYRVSADMFEGFDATGETDSTAAVQAALNFVRDAGGGIVTVPDGARPLLLSTGSLTVWPNCALAGANLQGVDDGVQGNLYFPWGEVGALVLDAGPGRTLLVQGQLYGHVIHRKGMTFPVTDSGASYAGEAIHAAGDGAVIMNNMILGFSKGIYARNTSRFFIWNNKFDCTAAADDACIDVRQSGDTGIIGHNSAWPYAGGGETNLLNSRAGKFIYLAGRNDWTQVIQNQEYGYSLSYDLQNEVWDDSNTYGPANVRIVDCRSDDGWNGTAPWHSGKIGVRIGTATEACKAFDVIVSGLQSSCAEVAAVYVNIESDMWVHVVNSACWNGTTYGLLYLKGGNAIVSGGLVNGTGPGIDTAFTNYAVTYDVAGGEGRLHVGGGLRVHKVATSNFRLGQTTPYFSIGEVICDPTKPMFDNNVKSMNALAGGTMITLPPMAEGYCALGHEAFSITGSGFSMTSLTGGYAGRVVTLLFNGSCTVVSGPVDANSMRLAGNANLSATTGSTITLMHSGALWFEISRSA